MGFNNPTPQTEDLYIKSINTTTDQYRAFLEEVRTRKLVLPNRDLDSSEVTKAGEYSLADESYAALLSELSAKQFNLTSPQQRGNILDYYSDLSLPIETKKDASRWQEVLADLDQLKSAPLLPLAAVNPAR
jgi:CRISPR/Cas system CSM-associated protein Csm2 small subunit